MNSEFITLWFVLVRQLRQGLFVLHCKNELSISVCENFVLTVTSVISQMLVHRVKLLVCEGCVH
jgi:hypothetical protein